VPVRLADDLCMFLGNDAVEDLDDVVGMATNGGHRAQLVFASRVACLNDPTLPCAALEAANCITSPFDAGRVGHRPRREVEVVGLVDDRKEGRGDEVRFDRYLFLAPGEDDLKCGSRTPSVRKF